MAPPPRLTEAEHQALVEAARDLLALAEDLEKKALALVELHQHDEVRGIHAHATATQTVGGHPRLLLNGLGTLVKQIQAEKQAMIEITTNGMTVSEGRVKSSSLKTLSAIVNTITHEKDLSGIYMSFAASGRGVGVPATAKVDVVAENGTKWYKLKVMKAEALHNIYVGRGHFNEKTLQDQARLLIEAARDNVTSLGTPTVVYRFMEGVSTVVAAQLESLGVVVEGERLVFPVDDDDDDDDEEEEEEEEEEEVNHDDDDDDDRHDTNDDCSGSGSGRSSGSGRGGGGGPGNRSANNQGGRRMKVDGTSRLGASSGSSTGSSARGTPDGSSSSGSGSECNDTAHAHEGLGCGGMVGLTARLHPEPSTLPCLPTGSLHSGAGGPLDVVTPLSPHSPPTSSSSSSSSSSFASSASHPSSSSSSSSSFPPHASSSSLPSPVGVHPSSLPSVSPSSSPSPSSSSASTSVSTSSSGVCGEMTIPTTPTSTTTTTTTTTTAIHRKVSSATATATATATPSPFASNGANLDVSTLLALVSDVCAGEQPAVLLNRSNVMTADEVAQKVALAQELREYLSGRACFMCETAKAEMDRILSRASSPSERERWLALLATIPVVPDSPSERALSLKTTGTIQPKHAVVFGTGDFHGAVTVTANSKVLRAAREQGVTFSCYIHAV